MSNVYNYTIDLKNEKKTTNTVVLKQVSLNNLEINKFEFPSNDIDVIIDALHKSKRNLVGQYGYQPNHNEEINPVILDTLVELFFSGISIADLSTQYNLPVLLIKNNLERKGIVLFDEF
ncbi:hypothetical protein IVB69_05385 [Flavobacterium sp. J49]|uniref:hypothetical protein n=1 Tax=Flavobacterium sp. J49 TaxID=2718534 RepID=UPI0015931A29|nr:hypothetical protein [Flavobacterium sp. J49]MBF6640903.1 hypothetical protein [Flavobacterium sp. J49]NIC02150.1 hypothetical protein [Flavobacterium sp. J49]